MRDEPFFCGHCQEEKPGPPKVMPGCTPRTGCAACKAKLKAGPYNGAVGSKGGGASAAAALKVSSSAGKDRLRILRWLTENGEHGAEDVAAALDLDADYVSPRLSELKTLGLVYKGPRSAVTERGNAAHVYGATEAGQGRAAA